MRDVSPGPGANRVYIDPGDRRTRDTTAGTYGHGTVWTRQLGPALGQAATTLFAHPPLKAILGSTEAH